MTELDALADRCNAVGFVCSTESRGTSYEGRDLKALHVIKKILQFLHTIFLICVRLLAQIITDTENEYFYMDSQTHAREWLSGATLMNIVNNV